MSREQPIQGWDIYQGAYELKCDVSPGSRYADLQEALSSALAGTGYEVDAVGLPNQPEFVIDNERAGRGHRGRVVIVDNTIRLLNLYNARCTSSSASGP